MPRSPRPPTLALAPFAGPSNGATPENPYTLHLDLQQTMNDLVGIIRKPDEVAEALAKLDELRERFKNLQVEGHRQFNPGWHLAIDLRNMLLVSECVAKSALTRTESRGGHTRDDHPGMDANWRKVLLVCRIDDEVGDAVVPDVSVTREPQVPMRPDLLELFDIEELEQVLHRRRAGRPPGTEGVVNYNVTMRVWRGDETSGALQDFTVEVNEGEVVLDIIHRLQQTQAPDLAVRWNCKAGKCGSCSAEINGRPKLMCMTRMSTFGQDEAVTVTPLRTFPVIRDLVTDVSFNYEKAREIPSFAPPKELQPGEYRMMQEDVNRSQEFRKCIECFLCQDTCHVIRDHEENKTSFAGPRYLMRIAELADASAGHPRPAAVRAGAARPRVLQHHQVLHRGLPRTHQDHRQRADPDEGARGGPQVRPGGLAGQQDISPEVALRPRVTRLVGGMCCGETRSAPHQDAR